MALSGGRASRRKNEPGILPAAYAFSSMSIVSGKKSMPSRVELSALAVMRTRVSPRPATTEPCDCGASLPVSKVSTLSVPETFLLTELASAMSPLSVYGRGTRRTGMPQWRPRHVCVKRRTTAAEGCRSGGRLAAEAELGVDGAVALDVDVAQVRLEALALADELQEAPAAVMVLLVHLQVLVELVDASGEERDLHLGRAGVGLVGAVLFDCGGLVSHVVLVWPRMGLVFVCLVGQAYWPEARTGERPCSARV